MTSFFQPKHVACCILSYDLCTTNLKKRIYIYTLHLNCLPLHAVKAYAGVTLLIPNPTTLRPLHSQETVPVIHETGG